MRVASLVPAASRILRALDAHDLLVACTHECGVAGVPLVARATIDVTATSGAIDAAVREHAAEGRPVVAIEPAPLLEARPDVVFVQDLCDVCAIDGGVRRDLVDLLGPDVVVVRLEASSLDGMFEDVLRVGDAVDLAREAKALASRLASRRRQIERRVDGVDPVRVAVIEWLDPPFSAGHWVPEQVAAAGGVDVLAVPGERSRTVSWDDVAKAAPDVVVLAPCGFSTTRVVDEARALDVAGLLNTTPAVQAGHLFAVDADRLFSCAGPDLVDGIALLASLLHPGAVDRPPRGRDWDRVIPS